MEETKDRQTDRGSHWMLTWNNPPEGFVFTDDPEDFPLEEFNSAKENGWSWLGQTEVGQSGTRHWQFCLDTKRQVRFSAVKKVFPACHIEKTKNIKKAESYVKKFDSRLIDSASQTDEIPKYTTKDFWEDLAVVWPNFHDITSDDLMFDFDLAVKCLLDSNIPCHMLAVQPQVRKAFLLYGLEIMAQQARLNPDVNSIVESNGNANPALQQESSGEMGGEHLDEEERSCEGEEGEGQESSSEGGQSIDSSDSASDSQSS